MALPTATLHHQPPFSPAQVLLRHRVVIPAMLGVLALAALAAAVGGSVLRTWDLPIQHAVQDARTPWLNDLIRDITRLGSVKFVFVGAVGLAAVAWTRCRALAVTILLATFAKPLIETVIKYGVGRDRPDLSQLVPGHGPSFPSGHVLAIIALWGLLPPVVALMTSRRVWWWLATAVTGTVIITVSFSRLYLGVHWFTDIVAGLAFGALYLVLVEHVLGWTHRHMRCPHTECREPEPAEKVAAAVV